MDYIVSKDKFLVSTDKNKIDTDFVQGFLTGSYWSPSIDIKTIEKEIQNSLCFGIYDNGSHTLPTGRQVGFARMITDHATFAYLCDVFIDEIYRHKGLGKWFMTIILSHPDLQSLRRILLATRDAHKLYEQLGFLPLNNPEKYMYYTPPQTKTK